MFAALTLTIQLKVIYWQMRRIKNDNCQWFVKRFLELSDCRTNV